MIDNKKYRSEEVFKVPENYFEELTDRVSQSVNAEEGKSKIPFLSLVRPHLMLAASMLGIVLVSYTLLRLVLPELDRSSNEMAQADIKEILLYEMQEDEMFELLAEMENQENSDIIGEHISDDDIIDYLMEYEINIDEIIQFQN